MPIVSTGNAWIWLAVCALLIANGAVRSNYLGPAYASLWAGGAVVLERASRLGARRWLTAGAAAVFAIGGLAVAPMALPLLPPERYVAYSRALGISAPAEERTDFGSMPIHYALRFGWDELLDAVERAHATLSPEERARAVVVGNWFGDTGAVNFFGPARGLPRAVSGHNNYWLWGPGDATGDVALVISERGEGLAELFTSVERAAEIDCAYCMPRVDRLGVYVVRGLARPLDEVWLALKDYQ